MLFGGFWTIYCATVFSGQRWALFAWCSQAKVAGLVGRLVWLAWGVGGRHKEKGKGKIHSKTHNNIHCFLFFVFNFGNVEERARRRIGRIGQTYGWIDRRTIDCTSKFWQFLITACWLAGFDCMEGDDAMRGEAEFFNADGWNARFYRLVWLGYVNVLYMGKGEAMVQAKAIGFIIDGLGFGSISTLGSHFGWIHKRMHSQIGKWGAYFRFFVALHTFPFPFSVLRSVPPIINGKKQKKQKQLIYLIFFS
ncbi:hypothetical protein BKA61DRAFT_255409 [Leptodontidium sp. MPI-SDFR-AT-0119]|nr:hypothetical protein BKA61DRAFT_255409 [Leptodontidium sp. MPI-SDFR-AT-0119]